MGETLDTVALALGETTGRPHKIVIAGIEGCAGRSNRLCTYVCTPPVPPPPPPYAFVLYTTWCVRAFLCFRATFLVHKELLALDSRTRKLCVSCQVLLDTGHDLAEFGHLPLLIKDVPGGGSLDL